MNTPLPSVFRNSFFSTQKKEYIQNSVFNFSILREKETDGYLSRSNGSQKGKIFVEENQGRLMDSAYSNSFPDLKNKCMLNIEDLKTNFTMKSVNYNVRVSFLKKECSNNNLNTVKRNLIPNLNDNMDVKCFLTTERKSKTTSKYNQILSERKSGKSIENINDNQENNDLNQKLDYILNSKKKKMKRENKEKLLRRKRKFTKF